MKDIRFNEDDGILVIGSGVFFYFQEGEVRDLFLALAKNFPDGEIFFDGQTKLATKVSNRLVRKTGIKDAVMSFYVNSPDLFSSWSPALTVINAEPFCRGIKRDKRWKLSTKIRMYFLDRFKMARFWQLLFAKTPPA
jgi:hypothetical protein